MGRKKKILKKPRAKQTCEFTIKVGKNDAEIKPQPRRKGTA
jgi:hypothetical protein